MKTSPTSTDPSDGTNVDEEDIVPAIKRSKTPPLVPKKPTVKRVSFNDETFSNWKDDELNENNIQLNSNTHEPNSNYQRISTNATNNFTCTTPKAKTNSIYSNSTVLKADSSFISDQSDIHIPNSDIIIPPPPPFMTDKNSLIDIQSVPLPPLPPPVDDSPNDSLPPVNLSTLPPKTLLQSRTEFFEIIDNTNLDFNKNTSVVESKPKSPSPMIPHAFSIPKCIPSADKVVLPVENNEPELIQVHLSNLPSVSHLPNVPCSLHPDLTSPILTQVHAPMHSSMTYPPINQPYMPLSTVSGSYNPFIVKDNTMTKALPNEPSFTNYHTIYQNKTTSASTHLLSTPVFASNIYTDNKHKHSELFLKTDNSRLNKPAINQSPIEKSPITPSNKISGGTSSMFGDIVEREKSTIDKV